MWSGLQLGVLYVGQKLKNTQHVSLPSLSKSDLLHC